jgi:prepilin-type N-terminal cleavage/methylation domain-containing protein
MRARKQRGFTLIELAIASAIIIVLATGAYSISRAGSRNASVGQAAFDIALRLQTLRSRAMNDGVEYLLVVVDAPSSDSSGCSWYSSASCTKLFVLSGPTAAWTLNGFDPTSTTTAATNASFVESADLPRGVHLLGAGAPATSTHPPAPFASLSLFDTDLTATCDTSRACFAISFQPSGRVTARPDGTASLSGKQGFFAGLASDLEGVSSAADRKGIVVGFPTGIVKAFSL